MEKTARQSNDHDPISAHCLRSRAAIFFYFILSAPFFPFYFITIHTHPLSRSRQPLYSSSFFISRSHSPPSHSRQSSMADRTLATLFHFFFFSFTFYFFNVERSFSMPSLCTTGCDVTINTSRIEKKCKLRPMRCITRIHVNQ